VVNEWIAEARGQMLLRVAAERLGAASAETEATVRALTDPGRIERMLIRLVDATATDWPDLVATE
jgi:hypothetical protein